MTTIVAPPSNASKWQMGFNSAFKGLIRAWVGPRADLEAWEYRNVYVVCTGNRAKFPQMSES